MEEALGEDGDAALASALDELSDLDLEDSWDLELVGRRSDSLESLVRRLDGLGGTEHLMLFGHARDDLRRVDNPFRGPSCRRDRVHFPPWEEALRCAEAPVFGEDGSLNLSIDTLSHLADRPLSPTCSESSRSCGGSSEASCLLESDALIPHLATPSVQEDSKRKALPAGWSDRRPEERPGWTAEEAQAAVAARRGARWRAARLGKTLEAPDVPFGQRRI